MVTLDSLGEMILLLLRWSRSMVFSLLMFNLSKSMSRTSILDRLEILSDEYKDVGSWVPKTTLQLCTLGEHKPSPSRVTLP